MKKLANEECAFKVTNMSTGARWTLVASNKQNKAAWLECFEKVLSKLQKDEVRAQEVVVKQQQQQQQQ